MRVILWGLVVLIVLALGYIRLAPSDPARWHQPVGARADATMDNGAVRVAEGGAEALGRLADALAALPRTGVLAGAVSDKRITYITRSEILGFPDYTTIENDGAEVRAFARSRFGKSDLGVNADRLDRVFAAAGL